MPLKKLILATVLGLSIALVGSFMNSGQKGLFTSNSGKLSTRPDQIGFSGKPMTPIRVAIHTPSGLPANGKNLTEIEASIRIMTQTSSDVHFQWVLPAGVELVKGEISGSLPNLQPGEEWKTSVTVQGAGSEELPKNIQINVSTTMSGQPISSTAIFASHLAQADGALKPQWAPARSGWFSSKASSKKPEPEKLPPRGLQL